MDGDVSIFLDDDVDYIDFDVFSGIA